ncbi:MAG: ATP-binding protein [Actinomycetota bacterium]|nr:ATP-binding protein [Actinomycetota bacterium]
MPTIGDALGHAEEASFIGREEEIATFEQWLSAPPERFEILNVYGPGGVGKTALLRHFRRLALGRERPVVYLDGRQMAPTEEAFLSALGGSSIDDALQK